MYLILQSYNIAKKKIEYLNFKAKNSLCVCTTSSAILFSVGSESALGADVKFFRPHHEWKGKNEFIELENLLTLSQTYI
jgi:hypothetical protein